jgi:2-C-methyl-D-erythritol 4-phosphate cytidylyltransferase
VTVAVVLTAAGSGARLGRSQPKALVPVRGEPLLVHAARRAMAARTAAGEGVAVLVVTAPDGHADQVRSALGVLPGLDATVVVGGASRQASVSAGLSVLPPDVDVVLVHDAARPFAPPELTARVVEAVRAGHRAVVPGLPVTDTVKRVGDGGRSGWPVESTVPREVLRAVQTPQGFDRALLDRAHAAAAADAHDEAVAASDDAGLVERLGEPVWVVPGDERAAKITTARDLAVAELLGDEHPRTEQA